jgi:hypothetical protein
MRRYLVNLDEALADLAHLEGAEGMAKMAIDGVLIPTRERRNGPITWIVMTFDGHEIPITMTGGWRN